MIWWTGYPSHKIDTVWATALPMLRRGFEGPELADDYYDKCRTGQAQLWCVLDDTKIIASLLTEIITIDSKKVCNVLSIGGHGSKDWLQFIKIIEQWAQSNECAAMRYANCRKGWARLLKDYQTIRIVLEKVL